MVNFQKYYFIIIINIINYIYLTDKYATSFATQLRENLKRSLTSFVLRRRVGNILIFTIYYFMLLKHFIEFLFQVARTLILGIFLGTIFIDLGLDQDGIRNRVSHIFFSCTFAGFVGFCKINLFNLI